MPKAMGIRAASVNDYMAFLKKERS